jgi:hypothetical protein
MSGTDDASQVGWSVLHAAPSVPSWMGAELDRLQAAFPAYSFGICRGWRGLAFEAWRDPGTGGLYAVITRDAGELWRELQAGQDGLRPLRALGGRSRHDRVKFGVCVP